MFFINKFMVIVSSPPTTLIIDADKGIVLENIGVYSEKYDERVFHVFIPYNNLCVDSPTSNVCKYIQSTQPNILEIGTTIPYYDTISTLLYLTNKISQLSSNRTSGESFHTIEWIGSSKEQNRSCFLSMISFM